MKPTTLVVRRFQGALWPVDRKGHELVAALPQGKPVPIRILGERSREQLALYWQILGQVVAAQGRWRTAEELHLALKVATGRIDVVQLLDGRLVKVPESVAVDQMSQDEFQAYFNDAMRIVCDEIMGGTSIEDLLGHTKDAAA